MGWLHKKNPLLKIGLLLFLVILLGVVFIPLLSPYHWTVSNALLSYKAPSLEHWFGTTQHGQDLFVTIWQGGRLSLTLALIGVIPYVFVGTFLGIISGLGHKRLDFLVSQFMTFIHAFPLLPLLLIFSIGLKSIDVDPLHILLIAIVIYSLFSTPQIYKVIRIETLRIGSEDYMKAADIMGISKKSKLIRHIFPNLAGFVVVAALQFMAHLLIIELLLFFIGIGRMNSRSGDHLPSWGNLIPNIRGDNMFREYTWTWLFPISTIVMTTISLRLISEGLRVAIDPKANQ
jgi:peptide/nickel transport system permease protein